jgi:hypothetical protein
MLLKFAFISLTAAMVAGTPKPPSTRKAPFVETFHRNGKTLIYVLAVHHSSLRYPDAMTDPVFKTIQQVFSTAAPDAVIIEGVDPSQLSAYCERSVQQCGSTQYNIPGKACDESSIAAYSAIQLGAQVYSGEPSASDELSVFKAHGYTIQDFLAFWILNNIPQEKRHGPLTEDGFRRLVDRIVSYNNYLLGTSVRFSSDDFARWYAKNMPSPHNYLDIGLEDADPYPLGREKQTVLHKLSGLNTQERDESVVKAIKTALQNHSRVLVVYGASHLDFEWKQLVQFMGVPKKTKPF